MQAVGDMAVLVTEHHRSDELGWQNIEFAEGVNATTKGTSGIRTQICWIARTSHCPPQRICISINTTHNDPVRYLFSAK